MVRQVMLSSRRLLVREASPSSNAVSLPVTVKATGKQPNLLFFELNDYDKTTKCQMKLGSAASRPKVLTQNPMAKSCVDGRV